MLFFKERESELKVEITKLRQELQHQSHQLQDNHNVVLSLQVTLLSWHNVPEPGRNRPDARSIGPISAQF